MENLRYNNINAPDADVDGMQFDYCWLPFLQFFPELIRKDICISCRRQYLEFEKKKPFIVILRRRAAIES
jgi:hypothetical protein